MNFKTTLFLLFLLLIVAVFYFMVESYAPPPGDDDAAQNNNQLGEALFTGGSFTKSNVNGIDIAFTGNTIKLTKEDTTWRQTSPVHIDLTSHSVERLIDDAIAIRQVENFMPGRKDTQPLKVIGLEPPRGTVKISYQDGDAQRHRQIALGNRLAVGGRGYVMLDGDTRVYIVDDDLHEFLDRGKIIGLREKNLDGLGEADADRVTLANTTDTIDLVKRDGNWSFNALSSGRANKEAVDNLLTDIGGVYINEFIADDPQDLSVYGLDEPQVVLTINVPPPAPDEGKDPGQPIVHKLCIGSAVNFKNEHYFATWATQDQTVPIVFSISKNNREKFDKSVNDMRDARVTPIIADDVRELTFDRFDKTLYKLIFADSAWHFDDPKPLFDPDQGQSKTLIESLSEAEAEAYQPQAVPGDKPQATVTIAATGRPEPDILKIYPSDEDDQYLVLRNNETTGHLVPADQFARLFEPVIALRDRLVLDWPRDQINRVVVNRADGVTYTFTREPKQSQTTEGAQVPPTPPPGQWQLQGHDRFERDTFNQLLRELLPLKAAKWHESPAPLKGGYTVKLTTIDGGEATIAVDPQSRMAKTTASGPPSLAFTGFEVSEILVEKIKAELRYRTIIDLNDDDIAAVTVKTNNQTTTITANEDGYFVGSQGEQIVQSAAQDLFSTLAGLRVKQFLAHASELPGPMEIEIKSKDDKYYNLKLSQTTGLIAPATYFNLDADTAEKLTAHLIDKSDGDAKEDAG